MGISFLGLRFLPVVFKVEIFLQVVLELKRLMTIYRGGLWEIMS